MMLNGTSIAFCWPSTPHTSTVGDLPVQEGRHQIVTTGFEIIGGCSLDNQGVLFFCFRRKGGVGNRANGERQERFVHFGVVHR